MFSCLPARLNRVGCIRALVPQDSRPFTLILVRSLLSAGSIPDSKNIFLIIALQVLPGNQ